MQIIPDYQTLMLPLLKNVSDGKEHKIKEIMESLSKEFSLGEEELNMMIPSGTQSIFYNRVSWAKTHLKKACLLNVEKGIIKITERGKNVLAENPVKIDTKFLNQFDEFLEFKNRSNSKKEKIEVEPDYTKQTPEELIDTAFQDFQKSLAEDLLEKIRNVSPSFFEKLVVALLVKMGYGGSMKDAGKAADAAGKTKDAAKSTEKKDSKLQKEKPSPGKKNMEKIRERNMDKYELKPDEVAKAGSAANDVLRAMDEISREKYGEPLGRIKLL